MKSIKLTPLWMFIFLLVILILSVLVGKSYGEGFTSRTGYKEEGLTGYANQVYPIVAGSIYLDKNNGNIVMQTGTTVDKIITRKGDESGGSSSVIKIDSPLATSVDSAWNSWSTTRGTNMMFYMPWDKITFAHLVAGGVHTSGFCFQDSSKFAGEYNDTTPGTTQIRGYESLEPVSGDRLDTHSMFKTSWQTHKQ